MKNAMYSVPEALVCRKWLSAQPHPPKTCRYFHLETVPASSGHDPLAVPQGYGEQVPTHLICWDWVYGECTYRCSDCKYVHAFNVIGPTDCKYAKRRGGCKERGCWFSHSSVSDRDLREKASAVRFKEIYVYDPDEAGRSKEKNRESRWELDDDEKKSRKRKNSNSEEEDHNILLNLALDQPKIVMPRVSSGDEEEKKSETRPTKKKKKSISSDNSTPDVLKPSNSKRKEEKKKESHRNRSISPSPNANGNWHHSEAWNPTPELGEIIKIVPNTETEPRRVPNNDIPKISNPLLTPNDSIGAKRNAETHKTLNRKTGKEKASKQTAKNPQAVAAKPFEQIIENIKMERETVAAENPEFIPNLPSPMLQPGTSKPIPSTNQNYVHPPYYPYQHPAYPNVSVPTSNVNSYPMMNMMQYPINPYQNAGALQIGQSYMGTIQTAAGMHWARITIVESPNPIEIPRN